MGLVPPWLPATRIGVVAALLASIAAVWWLDRARGWGSRRRSRLVLGVPWGTLVSVLLVLSVYLFLQDGWARWTAPLTIPFRSWSYLYPLGMAASAFAHNGPNHLIGNLVGAAVFGSLAEFAWGHFPHERGVTTFSSPLSNPYLRGFVLFPAGVVAVGVLTSLFGWGPVIGFSGVVFAFVGFALVRYPLGTVVALVVDDVARVVYRALANPVVVSEARPRFVEPWWAGIAIQGHLLGLFLGVGVGALALARRDEPAAARRWAGALLVAASLSLWAVWWFRGNSRFVLYRGIGVVLVLGIALAITLGLRVAASDRTFLDVPRRQVGVLVLVFPVLVVGSAAVPLNLTTVASDSVPPGSTVEIRDYTVTYAENVTNGQTSVVDLSALGETTEVRASGVIVVSEERHIWSRAVPASRLAFAGRTRVAVGGVGWRRDVTVLRRGWSVAGNGTVYRVWLRPPGGPWRLAYRSPPAVAEPTLAGRRVAVTSLARGFYLEIRRNGSRVDRVPIPRGNASVVSGDLRFVREEGAIYATYDGTRVRVATEETYRGE